MYSVFTGNWGKVTYYISGSITQTFLKFLYLDYPSWTYISTSFQYHSRLFDIRNASQKKSYILTETKHFYCNQLWRIQKFNWFKKGILQALQIVTTSDSSKLCFLQSYQQIYGLLWRLSFQASKSSRTKIIEENIDIVRNLVLKKLNTSTSISLPTPTSNSLPELVNTVERYAASLNIGQIITAANDILPRAQTCIESDGGAFEY